MAPLVIALLAAPAAQARKDGEPSNAGAIAAGSLDLLVFRPLGVVAVAAGLVFFVASAPFVAPAGNLSQTRDVFVCAPADYTFRRPLGEF